ncbi:MAG: hypothetical protein ACREB3_06575, partial [Burkholderiales bacterium]
LGISARQALLAKIRGDELLLKKSGIDKLEKMLAEEIIPARRDILRGSVLREFRAMVELSANAAHGELGPIEAELNELQSLTGKNKNVIGALMDKLHADRAIYQTTVKSYNMTRGVVAQQGVILVSNLSDESFERMIEKSRSAIADSWTTAGLNRGMRSLCPQADHQLEKIQRHSVQTKKLIDAVYQRFQEKHGFDQKPPPGLDLDKHRSTLGELTRKTEEFCKDPVNLMTEKHFLVKKFYQTLVQEARAVFENARVETQAWIRNAMAPLTLQMTNYRSQMERRMENIKKIHENIDSLQSRVAELLETQKQLLARSASIGTILAKLRHAAGEGAPRAVASAAQAAPAVAE